MKKTTVKIIAIIALLLIVLSMVILFAGCTAADTVNQNLSEAADNFECLRKITVYNARTDLIIMDMEGYMSLSNNSTNELVVTCKTGAAEYKKNYIYLNEYVIYVVEDITGTATDPYHYKVHFYTAMLDVDVNH
jgi:L-asparagine transporter-like permease